MNLIKKLLFMLSLIAGQLLVKTGAQTEGGYSTTITSTASSVSSTVPGGSSTTVSTASSASPAVSGGYPTIASTATSASSTVPGCNVMDVCLVVDRSGSICDSDPNFAYSRNETCNNWKYLVSFIHGLVNSFNIGPNNVRVALVTFSGSSEVQWGLNNYTDKASLLTAIDGLAYAGGESDTTGGLNLVNTRIFNAGNDRSNVAKLAIIFIEGKPSVPYTVGAALQAVHASSILTMCVSITDSIDEATLKALSSPPQQRGITYFMAANFSTINVISNSLQQQVCAVDSTTTSGPGCGGNYTNRSGTISSPNYPSNYDDDLHCSYYIPVPSQESVNITFVSFATEPYYDFLKVSCASNYNRSIYNQTFSGSDLPRFLPIRSCSNVLLEFSTDSSYNLQGFSLKYDIVEGMEGGLKLKPMNSYVRRDKNTTEDTILSCSSRANQTDAYPLWSFSSDGSSFKYITAPNCSVLSPIDECKRTSLSTSPDYSTRTCNLTIPSYSTTSANGLYICNDATLDYEVALVDDIVPSFEVSPMGTEVVQDDKISLTCSVRLFQKKVAHFQLTPSVYIYLNDSQSPSIASNTTATINVTASAEVLSSCVCNINFTFSNNEPIKFPPNYASNLPQDISLNLTSPPLLYWPNETSMVIKGDNNGTVHANGNLTCHVPANPPAIYQWTTKEYGFLRGLQTVAVERNGTYTCNATNIIRGKTYWASKSINITITIIDSQKDEPEDKFNSVALAVGVVLGIVVLLLLVVAIVQCVLLRRKKNSATMDLNYDFIDAVIRTDAGPAKPHVYELSQRRRLDVDQGGAVGTSGHRGVLPIPPMYDRVTDQTYDTEIHTEDKSQPYDTEIHTEDKSQPYDTEIHTEDKSQPKLQTYDDEIPIHTEDKSNPYLALYG